MDDIKIELDETDLKNLTAAVARAEIIAIAVSHFWKKLRELDIPEDLAKELALLIASTR